MRIAQVAPLYESVPPKLYGGTERVVSYLTEELVKQGHEVTLFASGDSITRAELVPMCSEALRLNPKCVDPISHHILMLESVLTRRSQFDVVHFHIDYMHLPLCRQAGISALTTLHGRLDIRDLVPLYREFREMAFVSISDAQRGPLPWLNWQGTVYHGLPRKQYDFQSESGEYLAFVGRTSAEKGLDHAIAIAERTGMPLKIAAKIDAGDRGYFESCIKPLLRSPRIEFLGEVGFPHKNDLLGNAAALLFPISWPEPFGMVMIEALACGTPVVAYRQGSVPEIVEDGRSGFIVDDQDGAANAVQNIGSINRAACRRSFEERFTADRMTARYFDLYTTLLGQHRETIQSVNGVPIVGD